jgi:hypothetical protein
VVARREYTEQEMQRAREMFYDPTLTNTQIGRILAPGINLDEKSFRTIAERLFARMGMPNRKQALREQKGTKPRAQLDSEANARRIARPLPRPCRPPAPTAHTAPCHQGIRSPGG